MSNKPLANWTTADGIPSTIADHVTNSTARLAYTHFPGKTAFDSSDIGKVIMQDDDKSTWMCTSISPVTFSLQTPTITARAGLISQLTGSNLVIQASNVPLSAVRPYDYGSRVLCWLYEDDLPNTAGGVASWAPHLPGLPPGSQSTGGNQAAVELPTVVNTKRARFTKASSSFATLTGLAAKLSSGGNCISHTVIARFRPLTVADCNVFSRVCGAGYTQYYLVNDPGVRLLDAANGACVLDTYMTRAQCTQTAAWVFDRENSRLSVYGNGSSASNSFSPAAGDAPSACYIGGASSLNSFDGWIHELLVIQGVLSYTEFLSLQKWMNRDYTVARVVGVGNSMMAGTALLGSIESVMPPTIGVFSGLSIGAYTTEQLFNLADTAITPQLVAGDKVLLFEDTNSILFGDTYAQLQAASVAWLNWANTNKVDLVRATVLPRSLFSPTQEALRKQWNTELLTNSQLYCTRKGFVADFASIPDAADPSNLTYYSDGTHPTAALATEMGSALLGLLKDASY